MKLKTYLQLGCSLLVLLVLLGYVIHTGDWLVLGILCLLYLGLTMYLGPANWQALRIRWATSAGNRAQEAGQYAKAEQHFQRALALADRGRRPPLFRAVALANLANLQRAQGRYEEAEGRFQEALQLLEPAVKPSHHNLILTRNLYGMLLLEKEDFPRAAQVLQRALAPLEDGPEATRAHLAAVCSNLTEAYRGLGRLAEAERACERALTTGAQVLKPDHPLLAQFLRHQGRLLLEQQKHAEAQTVLERSRALYEKAFGPEHPNLVPILDDLARLACSQGRSAAGETLYRQALAVGEKSLSRDHPRVVGARTHYSSLLRALKRDAEATELEAGARPGAV